MPVYDFRCQECGEVTELFLSVSSEDKKPICQSCGSHNMERMISAPSILRNPVDSNATCCGRTERCETPPCSSGGKCRRH